MVVLAMNARITLRGTRVTVRSRVKQTLVEVAEGSVVVDRPSDGAMVQVGAAGWTLIGEQAPLEAWEFMSGVNFNGEAVLVDGGTWLSQQKAAGEGLKAEVVGKQTTEHTDTELINLSRRFSWPVLTIDKNLKVRGTQINF